MKKMIDRFHTIENRLALIRMVISDRNSNVLNLRALEKYIWQLCVISLRRMIHLFNFQTALKSEL